jgi:hypothetical protein
MMKKSLVNVCRTALAAAAVLGVMTVASPPAEAATFYASAPTQAGCLSLQAEYRRYYRIIRTCSPGSIDPRRWWGFYYDA